MNKDFMSDQAKIVLRDENCKHELIIIQATKIDRRLMLVIPKEGNVFTGFKISPDSTDFIHGLFKYEPKLFEYTLNNWVANEINK